VAAEDKDQVADALILEAVTVLDLVGELLAGTVEQAHHVGAPQLGQISKEVLDGESFPVLQDCVRVLAAHV
jgi:hypothetical protein